MILVLKLTLNGLVGAVIWQMKPVLNKFAKCGQKLTENNAFHKFVKSVVKIHLAHQ